MGCGTGVLSSGVDGFEFEGTLYRRRGVSERKVLLGRDCRRDKEEGRKGERLQRLGGGLIFDNVGREIVNLMARQHESTVR